LIIQCGVSLGELVDKISILHIKKRFLQDKAKLVHVEKELSVLMETLNGLGFSKIQDHLEGLIEVNTKLWKIEDDIREKERNKEFDDDFIRLARSVYITNDERFLKKDAVNQEFGSTLQEVKSYSKYS